MVRDLLLKRNGIEIVLKYNDNQRIYYVKMLEDLLLQPMLLFSPRWYQLARE